MKIGTFLAKNSFKILLLLAVILSPLFFLSLPAFAPTLDKTDGGVNGSKEQSANTFGASDSGNLDNTKILAKSYLVYDADSGSEMASKNKGTVVSIASLTKLMTAFLVLSKGDLNEVYTIQKKNELSINPVLGVREGDQIQVKDLLYALLIGSANDAATSLGSYLESKTGKSVEELMNEQADLLEMHDTHYNNPIGFDSDTNYSTANDMRIMVDRLSGLIDFSTFDRSLSYSFPSFNGKTFDVRATNKLIASNKDIHAIKTGFTDDAQGAMIVKISPSADPSKEFFAIVLQSGNREADTLNIKEQILARIQPAVTFPSGL